MPAPPSQPAVSSDDPEHVAEIERLERERVALLLAKQELEEENSKLRKQSRTEVFPPVISIPPPPAAPVISSIPADDFERLKKQITKSVWGRRAIAAGVLAALAWNAFNTARSAIPIQKAEAAQARLAQSEREKNEEIEARVLERARAQQRERAYHCYFKQLRGAMARTGLDLTSLPSGGVRAVKLADEEPNRPGPPRFVSDEKCPDLPAPPPDTGR